MFIFYLMWIGILVQIIDSVPLKLSKPKAITSPYEFEKSKGKLTTTTTTMTDTLENDPLSLMQAPIQDYYGFYAQELPTSEVSSYTKEYNQNNDKSANLDKKSEFLQNEQPPPETNEPNYYIEKPIKNLKKYSSKIKSVNIKQNNEKLIEKENKKVAADDEYSYDFGDGYDILEKYYVPDMSQSELALPAESAEGVLTSDLNTGEVNTNPQRRSDNLKNQRVEFQMHGFKGPKSYKFGYDTGKGKNRQFRYEERNNEGEVIGHYGHYDRNGKVHITKYTAGPNIGFISEQMTK